MQVLLDTGPWVALIDRSESRHEECVEWLKQFEGEILSSEAVLTEVLYLLNFSLSAQFAALEFVLAGAVILVPASVASLGAARSLKNKYNDLPMDFADATLVSLAQDLQLEHVVTFDRKHFGIYRYHKTRSFTILP